MTSRTADGRLLAISDLHVSHRENWELLAGLWPTSPADWLIVAGDVAERLTVVASALKLLRSRFARVIWAPGNHELWTTRTEPAGLRGEERYRALVEICRGLDVVSPEDPYPVWTGPGGPATVAPLFLLYDYSFRPDGSVSTEEALAQAYETGVVCTDEMLLHPDPYASRAAWCEARVRETEQRLARLDPAVPAVLVNHYPLVRAPTSVLKYPQFASWCGTERTADWHLRFHAAAVVYGHLHIRRTTWHNGVPFMEVSVGYPKERAGRTTPSGLCQVLPIPASRPAGGAHEGALISQHAATLVTDAVGGDVVRMPAERLAVLLVRGPDRVCERGVERECPPEQGGCRLLKSTSTGSRRAPRKWNLLTRSGRPSIVRTWCRMLRWFPRCGWASPLTCTTSLRRH